MAGITLTSKTINSTYDSLLKLTDNDGLTASFKKITDGLGNDSGISINNAGNVQISGTLNVSGTTTIGSVLRGNATLTIDPAAHGDNTGLVVIAGDLQVDGTTTTINSTTVSLDDKNILLASDAANKAAANGAGITVETGTNDPVVTDATILYNGTNDTWDFNKWVTASKFVGDLTGDVTGTVSSISNHDTDDLSEGTTNLYFTDARARGAFSAGTGVTITSGEIAIGQSVGTGDTVQFDEIGINTVPDRRLHIKDNAEEVIRIESATTGAIHFRETSGSGNTIRGLVGYSNGTSIHTGADAGDFVVRSEGKLHLVSNTSQQGATFLSGKLGLRDYSPKSLLSLRGYGAIDSNANQGFVVTSNHYYDTADKYIGNGYAGIISHDTAGTYAGNFRFSIAGENTAGAGQAMTLTDVMRVDSDGLNVIGDIQGETARFTATSGHAFGDVVGTSRVVSFLNSTVAANNAMYLTIGREEATNNQGEISFLYVGDNSASNLLRLGLYGDPDALTIDGNSHVSVTSGNLAVDSGVIKMGANTVIDSSRNYTGGTGTFSGNLQVDDKITITGTNNNLVIDEESENTWHLYDTFQDNGIIIHSSTGGMDFQYNGVTEMSINGSGVVFTGTIDLSNANLNIGSADIVFDTISTNANRGLVWDTDGSYQSKLVSGGTNGGMVEIYTDMASNITGDVFRIKTGSTASTVISIANDEDISINGKAIFNDVAIFKGQASDYDGSDRGTYWSYDDKVAIALEPAADDGAVAMIFKSIGNAPSDFAYIAYDEDWGEAGVAAGENGTLLISSQNDGGGSSDHVRVLGRLVVQAETSSSNPTNAFQVKSSNTTSDLFRVARSGASVFSSTLNVADQLTVDDAIRLTSNPTITGDSSGVYFWNQAGVGATIASNAFEVRTNGNTTAFSIDNSQIATIHNELRTNGNILVGGNSSLRHPALDRFVNVQSTTNGAIVGYNLAVIDGANNRRGSFFMDDSAGIYGIDHTYSSGSMDFVIRVAGGELMRVLSNGIVSIGTPTPVSDAKLVVKDGNTYLEFSCDNAVADTARLLSYDRDNTAFKDLQLRGANVTINNASGEIVRVNSSGNVGIGVNPSYKLEVAGQAHIQGILSVSTGQQIRIGGASDGNHFLRKIATGYSGVTIDGPQLQGHQGGELTTNYTGDNWALRWAIGGNVFINNSLGINTSSVNEKLSVNGAIRTTGATTSNESSATIAWNNTPNEASFESRGKDNTARGKIVLYQAYANGTNGLRVLETDSLGNIGIGTVPKSWATAGNTKGLQISTRGAISEAYDNVFLSNNYYFDGSERYIETNVASRLGCNSTGSIIFENAPSGTAGSVITFAERMRIDSSGNVGIGTSPSYKLQVQKTSTSAPAIMVGGSFAGGPRIQTYGLDADSNAWMGLGTDMGGNPYEHSVYFPQVSGYDGVLTFGSYNGTTYSTKMVIRSSGFIGMGTSAPQAKLDVNGTVLLGREHGVTQLHNNKDYNNMASGLVWREYNATGTYAHATSSTTLSDYIKSYNFTEQGIATTVDSFTRSDDTYAVEFVGYYYANVDGVHEFSASSDDSSDFFIDGTRVAYWYGGHGDNNLPTGGTGQVAGSIYLVKGFHRLYARFQEGTGGDSISLWQKEPSGSWEKIPSTRFYHKAEDLFRATGSGNVTLTGTFTATADIVAYSDERIKENVETIDNALDKVNQLRGVSFNRKADQKKSIGVIAQEIEKVLPEVVTEDEQGIKGVSYGNIVGVLIEAIKEQQKQIDELKKMIE